MFRFKLTLTTGVAEHSHLCVMTIRAWSVQMWCLRQKCHYMILQNLTTWAAVFVTKVCVTACLFVIIVIGCVWVIYCSVLLQECQYTSKTNVWFIVILVTWYVWVWHVTTWAWLVVLRCLWQKCALTYGQKIEQWHEVTQLLWVIRRTKTNIFGTLHKSRLWKTMLVREAYCTKTS